MVQNLLSCKSSYIVTPKLSPFFQIKKDLYLKYITKYEYVTKYVSFY